MACEDDFLCSIQYEDDPIPAPSMPSLLTGTALQEAIRSGVHYNDIRDRVSTDIRRMLDGIVHGCMTVDHQSCLLIPQNEHQWLFTGGQISACEDAIGWVDSIGNPFYMVCHKCGEFHFPWHLVYKNLDVICHKCKDKHTQ